MKIIKAYQSCPDEALGSVMALGNFDGIHRGHKAVIRKAVAMAQAMRKPAAVMTFEPHPLRVFQPATPPFALSDSACKELMLAPLGVDYLFEIPFDKTFSELTANQFIEDVLIESLQVSGIVTGYDFIFGHQRGGNAALLREVSHRYGYEFARMDVVGDGKTAYSSTRIRNALKSGDVELATQIADHHPFIHGLVQEGDKRGRTIGFPTANITLGDFLPPAEGVYAVFVMIDGEKTVYPAVANFGRRPTFGDGTPLLEIHIPEQTLDLYGKQLWVEYAHFIRPEKKFSGLEALKKQIGKDVAEAKHILSTTYSTLEELNS